MCIQFNAQRGALRPHSLVTFSQGCKLHVIPDHSLCLPIAQPRVHGDRLVLIWSCCKELQCLWAIDQVTRQATKTSCMKLRWAKSPIASVQRTQSTLAGHSAGPRGTNTTLTNANRAIRIAVQRTHGLRGPNSVFLGGDMTANER